MPPKRGKKGDHAIRAESYECNSYLPGCLATLGSLAMARAPRRCGRAEEKRLFGRNNGRLGLHEDLLQRPPKYMHRRRWTPPHLTLHSGPAPGSKSHVLMRELCFGMVRKFLYKTTKFTMGHPKACSNSRQLLVGQCVPVCIVSPQRASAIIRWALIAGLTSASTRGCARASTSRAERPNSCQSPRAMTRRRMSRRCSWGCAARGHNHTPRLMLAKALRCFLWHPLR